MTKKALITLTVAVLFCGLMVATVVADTSAKADRLDAKRAQNVSSFNIGVFPLEGTSDVSDGIGQGTSNAYPWDNYGDTQSRRPLGAASINVGEGVGESIDLTFNDAQSTHENGRQVAHWWNGEFGVNAQVSVHFAYRQDGINNLDTTPQPYGNPVEAEPVTQPHPDHRYTAYNVYDATVPGGDWPLGQDDGCDLQSADTAGSGYTASLDMMYNGRVVMGGATRTAKYRPDLTSFRVIEGMVYYQGDEYNCVYNPYTPLNVTWIDSLTYQPTFLSPVPRNGIYLRNPQVVTQWDGTNTIVHLLAGENAGGTQITTAGYGNANYWIWLYFRKVGDVASAGTWGSMIPIDTIDWVNVHMTAQQYPGQGVACAYANISPDAIAFNQADRDVFARESFNRGVTWQPSYNITQYDNASEGSTNHGNASFEVHAMYDSENDLHVWFNANPTSANPYFDGFFWSDFNRNVYHWEKTNDNVVPGVGDIVKVANGNFMDANQLTGGINRINCGFGGSNAGYIAWTTMGECDGKLYLIWSQIHERANADWAAWQNAAVQPAAGILDDCSRVGNRGGMANYELMMSVARLETSTLWDFPRNVSNTYRPACGLPGDPLASTVCASEWKPQLEKFALDESGLDLYWPAGAEVDMSPGHNYAGGWYINMEYLDDQFPGNAYWGGRNAQGTAFWNPPPTWNSEKWVRLACVDPIEASRIAANPTSVQWPEWVPLNTTEPQLVEVLNEGNVALNITQIGTFGGSWLSTSENPTVGSPWVIPAGVTHTDTMFININTAGITQPTWLEGYVWLKSNAVNTDSLVIQIRVLAAAHVEPTYWDTVMTHADMYSPYVPPLGSCVGLSVGNFGEMGQSGFGTVNLDFTDAAPNMPIGRRECDTTVGKTTLYLVSATPYVILADATNGTGAEMTQSFNDLNQADETGFDPTNAKGSMGGGLAAGGAYDSVYTGRFVNRDTTIAMERIVYGPRSASPATSILDFVIVYTKVYSADGQPHNHLTVGNVADWDVPADNYNHNAGGVHSGGNFVYVRGTDTTGHDFCALHAGRYAAEAFGGGYTSTEWLADNCTNDIVHKGSNGVYQAIMVDTTHMRDGTPLDPWQPNPLVWWQTAAVGGLNIDPIPDTGMDLCVYMTYKYDYNLAATDTLHYWSVMTTTPIGGTLTELASQVSYAKNWYTGIVRGCETGCCVGRVGDANNEGDYPDEVTLGDIMLLVDVKFISSDCSKLVCIDECDVNQDGGASPTCEDHVTLGDIMYLVDFLFITGPENGHLNDCL